MEIINTGIVVIPDLPHSWEYENMRICIRAIEEGMGDKYAMRLLLGWGAPEELEMTRAAYGMKAMKGPKKYGK